MEKIVKHVIFNFITRGHELGLNYCCFITPPKQLNVSNLDDMIKYGTDLLNSIDDEHFIGDYHYEDIWKDILIK